MTKRFSRLIYTFIPLSFFLAPLASHAVALKQKFVPSEDKVLLIVGQDREAIENYIEDVGVIPAGFTFYTSVQKMDGFASGTDHGGGVQDASYLLDRYPFEVIQIGLYMVGALDGVINGNYDQNIDRLGEWIRKSRKLVFLRIGYEFDNPQNNYEPAQYIRAYRYIADHLRLKRVNNVAFVWHSYSSQSEHPLADWYPGDDYVDWVAITYFNPYNTDNMDKVVEFAQPRNKPVMIAESAPIKLGTDQGEQSWQRWYAFIFDYIKTRNIKAFCYINCDWDKLPLFAHNKWGDSRIEANRTVKSKWLQTIQEKNFINHSPHLRDFASQAKVAN